MKGPGCLRCQMNQQEAVRHILFGGMDQMGAHLPPHQERVIEPTQGRV